MIFAFIQDHGLRVKWHEVEQTLVAVGYVRELSTLKLL